VGQDKLPHYLSNLVQENAMTRLNALRELRQQTDRMLDALQDELVEQALKETSMPEVAKVLGMTHSTAHRKYGHLLPEKKRRRGKKRNKIIRLSPPPAKLAIPERRQLTEAERLRRKAERAERRRREKWPALLKAAEREAINRHPSSCPRCGSTDGKRNVLFPRNPRLVDWTITADDLIVLCPSCPDEERRRAWEEAEARWPPIDREGDG
jgi:hypothetical protein